MSAPVTVSARVGDTTVTRDLPSAEGVGDAADEALDQHGVAGVVVTDVRSGKAWLVLPDGTRYGPVVALPDTGWESPADRPAQRPERHLRLVGGVA